MTDRKSLRFSMRDRRRALSVEEQREASLALSEQLAGHRLFHLAQRIAFYLPNDGEIDLTWLIEYAWQQNKQCYLPVLGPRNGQRMWFLPYRPDTRLIPNRFGIPEPAHRRRDRLFSPMSLDLVLMPLVAFDHQGNRVGMGGGFYDRTFGFRRYRRHWQRPWLLGTAYAFQQVEQIDAAIWDVPLDGIATEQGLLRFQPNIAD
ncbi:MAG: 5-formyltetrahydrofolate cyclo-ligase [Thiohalophilus sp.]|uniref:5-formyltetrahydrofolate cyclo-ligase n=1 Tax=Thiohalophilus sp. TaxID=3028392 RepID=UPI00287019B0|nr:5-formyltetrahydrofolate cyclo-ligase [Thiohalophilus sp.]MDR9435895.1 5-formyltetrahydrofolate cyclo-ligase [Thiohalophilus sp.]